ncbi:MAG: type III secretion system export apparatus subunit SctV [Ectothiorhodospiraceae bacterium]|nr:type III secretion system export apparatus subunit SctV [Ectothiorhodospiraceae bacterium]
MKVATGVRQFVPGGGLARHHDLWLVMLVVAAIGLMVLPMPPVAIDLLITVNLTVSIMLLMVALYIGSPLGLSTLPSLLLFTTLFRLALNIASTRQILTNAYAGDIIDTFGSLVVGRDIIGGAVVFLIIAIVQFIVIAKGSERVAEVGARFTLDAMPGKQMSIDSDLRAGIIDKNEARERRSLLERESQLYGSMDGAMKFVKGDAIAGLIIAAVNIIAGMAIGTLRHGMDMDSALHTYSILTVGDALVSQIPSLFVAITAGIIITRVSKAETPDGNNLGNEIANQIRAHPKALLIAGGVIMSMIVVPGFPKLHFLAMGAAVGLLGYYLLPSRKRHASPGVTPIPAMSAEGSKHVPQLLDLSDHSLAVPVVVQAFSGIEHCLQPERLDRELSKVRRQLSYDMGVPFPGIMVRAAPRYPEGQYTVYVNEIPVDRGEMRPNHLLAAETETALTESGIQWQEGSIPMLGRPALWVHHRQQARLDRARQRYLWLEQVFATHLGRIIRRHAHEFIGIQETQLLLSRLAERNPDLDRELQRSVSLPRITDVLRRLVREDISIRNLNQIAHALIEWGPHEKDPVLLTEYVRTGLSRFISYRFAAADGTLPAVVLHPGGEEKLREARRQTSAGTVLMLDPGASRELVEKIKLSLGQDKQLTTKPPVLLTSLEIRPYLRKLTETELGRVPVLSYQELEPVTRITPVATVEL